MKEESREKWFSWDLIKIGMNIGIGMFVLLPIILGIIGAGLFLIWSFGNTFF